MDLFLWFLSWFEFPIFGILFFIGTPLCVLFIIYSFRKVNREIEEEKAGYEEFKAWKKNREQFYDSVNGRRKK